MSYILAWVSSWFSAARISRDVKYLDIKISRLNDEVKVSDAKLAIHRTAFEKLQKDYEQRFERVQSDLRNAEKINERLQEALSATREELQTAEKITIPALVQAHRVVLGRWEAEASILAMKTSMAMPTKDLE